MPSVNQKLYDVLVGRQIDLVRLANEVSASILSGAPRDADERLVARLAVIEGRLSPSRARALEDSISRILARQGRALRPRLNAHLDEVAGAELEMTGELLGRVFAPLGVSPRAATAGELRSAVRSTPVRGARFATMLSRLIRGDRERVLDSVRSGLRDGVEGPALARAVVGTESRRFLDGVRQVTRRAIDVLVHTATTHAASVARSLLFAANPDLIREERWISTLDSRTSSICWSLDGRVFPVGKGIHPPAHLNCRSGRVPIVPALRALPDSGEILPATVAESFDGKPPNVLTYPNWLKTQPDRVVRRVLGPTRFKLWKNGAPIGAFVNDRGQRITLDQLRSRVPEAFEDAGL